MVSSTCPRFWWHLCHRGCYSGGVGASETDVSWIYLQTRMYSDLHHPSRTQTPQRDFYFNILKWEGKMNVYNSCIIMDSTWLDFLVYATRGYAYAIACAQKTSLFHPTPSIGHSFHSLSILPYCRGHDLLVTLFTLLSMAELCQMNKYFKMLTFHSHECKCINNFSEYHLS